MKEMHHFAWLTGDINWVDHGGVFYRCTGSYPGGHLPIFHLIDFNSWDKLIGERDRLRDGIPKYNAAIKAYDYNILDDIDVLGSLHSNGLVDEEFQLSHHLVHPMHRGPMDWRPQLLPPLSGKHPSTRWHDKTVWQRKMDEFAVRWMKIVYPKVVLEALNCCGYDERLSDISGNNWRKLMKQAKEISHANG